MMKRVLLSILLAFLLTALVAEAVKARYVSSNTKAFPMIISSLQVLDSSDEPITDLIAKDFKVRVDGKQTDSLRTTTYSKTGRGINVLLCIDASGSMNGQPIAKIKQAIIPFIDKMRSVDKIAIAIYADDFELLTDFTSEKELLKKTVNGIKPVGRYTSLYYGAYKALERLKSIDDSNGKIMILMGDGKDENPSGSYKENDVIQSAIENSIPVFTVGYTKVEPIYLQSFERIADQSGGSYYYSPGMNDLDAYFEKLHRQIMNIYVLSYLAQGITGDGNKHRITISINTPMGSKDVSGTITAPEGVPPYYPPTEGQKKASSTKVLWLVAAFMGITFVIILVMMNRRSRKKQEEIEALKRQKIEEQRHAEEIKPAPVVERIHEDPKDKPLPKPKPVPNHERTMIIGNGVLSQEPVNANRVLKFEIIMGSDMGKVFFIDSSGATIGRAVDNQIVLTDIKVSSHHAKISYIDSVFVLEDLGSTNGIYINGNKTNIYRLQGSNTIKIGGDEGSLTLQ